MSETRPLNIFVTGASKNIGREIGLFLAQTNVGNAGDLTPEIRTYPQANVIIGYRTNNPNNQRRNAKLVEAMRAAGSLAVAVQGDLVLDDDRVRIADEVGQATAEIGGLDAVVLNAAGGLEEDAPEGYGNLINNVAQVDLVDRLTPHFSERPTVVLVESS